MKIKLSIALILFAFLSIGIFQSCANEENTIIGKKIPNSIASHNRDFMDGLNGESLRNSCTENIKEDISCPFKSAQYPFTHREYPGCTFVATYMYRECIKSYDVVLLSVVAESPCEELNENVSAMTKLGDYILNRIIYEYAETNAPPCSTGGSTRIANIYKANCTKSVYSPDELTVYELPCGVSCCRTEVGFCRDAQGFITWTTSSSKPLVACEGPVSPDIPGTVDLSPCQANCFKFYPFKTK